MRIRKAQANDQDAIRRIVISAFGQVQEADLVDNLSSNGDLVLSLVAEKKDNLLGHIALSCLKSPEGAWALAPVSVLPEVQGQGIGSALIEEAILSSKEMGADIIFVLGDPDYYGRFGFSAELAAKYSSPYAGLYFMALSLSQHSIELSKVIYADAFSYLKSCQ